MGFNQNGTQTIVIGGTKTTGDVLTITSLDAGLSGGKEATPYTVQSTDTLTSIATGLAAAINADTHLSGISVSATSSSTVVFVKSASTNLTTYQQSVSTGATETLGLSTSIGGTQANYNGLNELVGLTAADQLPFKGGQISLLHRLLFLPSTSLLLQSLSIRPAQMRRRAMGLAIQFVATPLR